MSIKISIIIPSFQRAHLLKWNLITLSKQRLPNNFETIVLNDGIVDDTEILCKQYEEKLNIKYLFTGQRNINGQIVWRVPGFAINIAVKKCTGDVILICCAEIFHMNNSIDLLTSLYNYDNTEKILAIPKAKDDNGNFLKYIESTNGQINIDEYNKQPNLINVKFPFFLAMRKQVFMDIGGYDEDFTGTDYDDSDLMGRLETYGCTYVETDASVIHLWHPRLTMTPERIPRFEHNKKLFEQRQGIIVRNKNREWGLSV